MTRISTGLSATVAILAAMLTTSASAQPTWHHRHHHGAAPAYGYGYGYGAYPYPYYYYGGWQGAAIAAATARAQREPGVTSELAPDAAQTATGGPSGGIPGFGGR